MKTEEFSGLLQSVRACRVCRDNPASSKALPHEPRPVLQLSQTARVLLAGQAPGARVHASGRPFTDASGDRLRHWLGLTEDEFYDPAKLAIVPMGFCFPGYDSKGSDKPPRKECRLTWHDRLFASRPAFDITLILGRYARDYHLPALTTERLTDTILSQRQPILDGDLPSAVILPHPSWRNTAWLKRNPWFEADIIPIIQAEMRKALEAFDAK